MDFSRIRLNSKLHNRFTAKRFTEKDLFSLADWKQKKEKSNKSF